MQTKLAIFDTLSVGLERRLIGRIWEGIYSDVNDPPLNILSSPIVRVALRTIVLKTSAVISKKLSGAVLETAAHANARTPESLHWFANNS